MSYFYDPEGVSAERLLELRPSTALEQLRVNSEETARKMGHQRHVANMLRDFPLLFDVRDVELTGLNMYVKDLFMGYKGAKERTAEKERKSVARGATPQKPPRPPGDGDAHPLRAALTATRQPSVAPPKLEDAADLRGRFKDTVFVDKVDLRNKLRDATAPEGIDLYVLARSFVVSAIQPVLSEADILASLGHVLSGVFAGPGLFGSSSAVAAAAAAPSPPRIPSSPAARASFDDEGPRPSFGSSIGTRSPAARGGLGESSVRVDSRKPKARPLAKRAYAYVDRLRGASKYPGRRRNLPRLSAECSRPRRRRVSRLGRPISARGNLPSRTTPSPRAEIFRLGRRDGISTLPAAASPRLPWIPPASPRALPGTSTRRTTRC